MSPRWEVGPGGCHSFLPHPAIALATSQIKVPRSPAAWDAHASARVGVWAENEEPRGQKHQEPRNCYVGSAHRSRHQALSLAAGRKRKRSGLEGLWGSPESSTPSVACSSPRAPRVTSKAIRVPGWRGLTLQVIDRVEVLSHRH